MIDIAIGIDPGGACGTTGMVVCRDWKRRCGMMIPVDVEAIETVKVGMIRAADALALEIQHLRDNHHGSILVAVEDVRAWPQRSKCNNPSATPQQVLTTAQQVGMFRYVAAKKGEKVRLLTASDWRIWWFGKAQIKNPDAALTKEVLRVYGGREAAVGGRICAHCRGQGRAGRGLTSASMGAAIHQELVQASNGKWYRKCQACDGEGKSPTGPLWGSLWAPSRPHCRVALGVAICAYHLERSARA